MEFGPFLEQAAIRRCQAADRRCDHAVMVVSGHRLLQGLIMGIAGQSRQWVGAASSEREALGLLAAGPPDLLIVIAPLLQGSGVELVRQARRLHPDLPCLLLHQGGGGPAAPVGLLSPREREVVEQLVRGCANAEIAGRLHLSVETVRSHMKAVQLKLQARGRTHAAVIALRQGLVRWEADD